MKMKNTAPHTIKIESILLEDDAWTDDAPRPVRVEIPSGAVVSIKDEYAMRSRPVHATLDPDTGKVVPSSIVEGRAFTLSGGALKPHGPLETERYVTIWHHQLPSVKAAFEELARAGAADRGEVDPRIAKPRFH